MFIFSLCNSNFTSLDKDILRGIGGTEATHSFIRINDSETDLTEISENETEPCIIRHSSYHTIEDITSILQNNVNKFSIFSSNIQSLQAKWHLFQIYIERLRQNDCFFNVICLQECWLGNDFKKEDYNLDGYQIIHQNRHCSTAGGLIIYLQDKFKYKEKTAIKHDHWEGQFIQIKKNEYLSKSIILGNIYRCTLYLNEHYNEFSH